jgi:hypothetical protein
MSEKKSKNLANLPSKTQIQQGNDLVKAFFKMNSEQTNIFYYAISKMETVFDPIRFLEHYNEKEQKVDFKDFVAKFSMTEMLNSMDLPNSETLRKTYLRVIKDMSHVVVKLENQRHKKYMPLFSLVDIDKETNEIEVIFNPIFFENVFSSRYTNGQLKILGQLSKGARTNYAQRLYFYLTMYRNTQGQKQYHNDEPNSWTVEMTEEYFRDLVQMEKEKNPRKDAFRRCINGLISKINKINFEFSTSVSYTYGTNKMTFLCTENMNLKKLEKDENTEMRIQKLAINKEQEDIKYFRKKYSEEFEKEYQNQLKNEVLDFGTSNKNLRNEIAEFEAYKIIKERYSLQ